MDASVEDLKRELALTGYKINEYCDLLLLGKTEVADNFVSVVTDALSSVVPKILRAYSEVESLREEDSSIWGFQLKRILSAMSSDDDIKKIDVLKLETVELFRILLEALGQSDGSENL